MNGSNGSLSRTWAVCKLDLLHNLRRPLFWIWLLILALTSWGLVEGNVQIGSGDSVACILDNNWMFYPLLLASAINDSSVIPRSMIGCS